MKLNPKLAVAAVGLTGLMAAQMDFTKPHEGISLTAYLDSVGVPTICYGKTSGVRMGMTMSPAECERYLQVELKAHCEPVFKNIDPKTTPVGVFLATCDWVYQYGETRYHKSTIKKLLVAKDFRALCGQFPRWKYAGGKDCTYRLNNCYGVITRNLDREALCLASL